MSATDSSASAQRLGKAPVVIAVILSVFALHVGAPFFIPIAMALLLQALLRRPVRSLEALHVPTPVGALIVVAAVMLLVGAAGYSLAGPLRNWVDRAPASIATAQARLRTLRGPVERLAQAASGDGVAADTTHRTRRTVPPPVVASSTGSSVVSDFVGRTTIVIGGLVEIVLLLYLLLSSGDMFRAKLLKVLPARGDKKAAVDILHFAESVVVQYLLFTAVIAAGQGVAVGLAMWALGMPDPVFWGLLTAACELIPWLGAAAMLALLSVTALTVFDSVGHAALVPLTYVAISTIQNNVVTPLVFGGRLRLNPVAVLLGVVFWYLVWGIPGAFLAIPILAMLKALSEEFPGLTPLSEFLSD